MDITKIDPVLLTLINQETDKLVRKFEVFVRVTGGTNLGMHSAHFIDEMSDQPDTLDIKLTPKALETYRLKNKLS